MAESILAKVEIPQLLRQLIAANAKTLEVKDFEVANAIEATGKYYIDRFSDSRNCYILMRRERTRE